MADSLFSSQIARPLVAAGVGAFMLPNELPGASFTISEGIPVIGGQTYSTQMVGASLGFATSFIVEALNKVLTQVPKSDSLKSFPSFITHVGGAMGSWALLPMLVGDIDGASQVSLAKTGLLAEMVSQWVFENFVEDGSFGQDMYDLVN